MVGTFAIVDLAGFTALTEAHGDAAAAELARTFAATVRSVIPEGGRLVKTMGDAVLVVTPDPAGALDFVTALWDAMATGDAPCLRAGVHHGTAVEVDEDVFGAAVNLTARIAAQARADEALATAAVAGVAAARGIAVTALGPVTVRNALDPVEVFALAIRTGGVGGDVVDPVCRMRVERRNAAGHLRYVDRDYYFCSLECTARFAERPEAYAAGG